jgi:hypothetical protein
MENTSEVIRHMVDNILQGNNTDALKGFEDIVSDKITDSIEARKVEIASTLGAKDEDTE